MSTPYNPEHITYFAETDYRNERKRFGIKSRDRTRHMYVIGKSGVGKSTLLENMAIQDIQQGEGIAVLDPHGSFAEKVLDYVPEHRIKDVVYFAPFDTENPVSFNVLEDVGQDRRHFVASGLMSTFKKIWVDAWSARMEYILNNILLALLEYPDATLLGVNRMLADKDFRNKVVANVTDPGVKAFWVDEFAKYGERYMQEAGAAIQNKIGQFTANPLIRNIIGQPKSSFDVRSVMDEQKILIINLSKGRIGEQNTSLLGSMLITKIYLGAMSRADVSATRMSALPNFYFYVDEFQSFANETFADILAEARKYKLALIIAHQYVAQMEEKVRDAVFGNVGTTISFRVGPLDAELLEKVFSPQFSANDLINLGMAQIYLSLMINDIGSQPFSAKTLPPLLRPTITYKDDVIEYSRRAYARQKSDVEVQINTFYQDVPKAEERFIKKENERPQQSMRQQAAVSSPQNRSSSTQRQTPQQSQSKTPTKPFEKAFSRMPSVSRHEEKKEEDIFLPKTASMSVTKTSPALESVLRVFDTPSITPSDSSASTRKVPFEGEKSLRETIGPVKVSERGPSEKHKDLLRAALQKAGAAQHTTSTPSVPPVVQEKKDILHAKEFPESDSSAEISSHELQNVFD
ncbi:type IV secretion system DNA-binding domain-containing protein [Candidatus Nomurabacteria bacterium]|nr:type IV secretion system DNA-binding domain-containing protein [Candidatus Nomurabacteria bacterium]